MPYTPPDHLGDLRPPLAPLALQEARARAIGVLTDRYADDSISEAEFEARLSWLSAADTVARLDALVADLAEPGAVSGSALQGDDLLPFREQRLAAVMSSTERTGQWTMPYRLVLRAVMSEVRIDLRYASLPPACEIDLSAVMASVRIIVPPELGVECDVSAFMASVRNEATQAQWPGAPRLHVTGSAVMADVHVEVMSRMR